MAGYREQMNELGLKILQKYLIERFESMGYKFVKALQFGFKKKVGDLMVEIVFYRGNYELKPGSIEKYDCPVVAISGRYRVESKAFNAWRDKTFVNEPLYNALLWGGWGEFEFMVDVTEPEFIIEDWKVINQQNADSLIAQVESLESKFTSLKDWEFVMRVDERDRSLLISDVLMFLDRKAEALAEVE